MKIHVNYGITTGIVTGWSVFDDDTHSRQIVKGEAQLVLTPQQYAQATAMPGHMQGYVNSVTGMSPDYSQHRYLMINNQTAQIEAVHVCDTGVFGAWQGHTQYAHPTADTTWTFDPKALTVTSPMPTAQDIAAAQSKGNIVRQIIDVVAPATVGASVNVSVGTS